MIHLVLSFALVSSASAGTAKKSLPEPKASVLQLRVQYLKTGKETQEVAEQLGKAEIENSNPCVAKMRSDVKALQDRPELREAIETVSKAVQSDVALEPYLVLRYMNEAMELRFELRTLEEKERDGTVVRNGVAKYRKGVFVSDKAGTWQDRLDGDLCNVPEDRFLALVDELREADRLASCILRKKDLLGAAGKISNYIHSYLPANWLEEARKHLALQNAPVSSLLREDLTIYRQGNSSFRDCLRGLRLLEEEAASSVRVLNQIRETKKGTEVPSRQIDELEELLSGTAK